MIITFTLQQAYSGSTYEVGPFNISGVTNTGVVTELGSNISKSTLLSGYTANDVNDATTGGTINSTGTCTTSRPWTVSGGGTTPTPTTTPSCYCFRAENVSGEERTISYTKCSGTLANDVPMGIGAVITDCTQAGATISTSGGGVVITTCTETPCTFEGDCSTCGSS